MEFLVANNLTVTALTPGQPWDFTSDELETMRKLPKDKRRQQLLVPTTRWQVYTSVRGSIGTARISKDNPASALLGLVADFDMVSDLETVLKYLNQMPEEYLPNFIEISLGKKIRLVWLFPREVLVPGNEFCQALISTLFDKLGVPTLLAGYDKASEKPTEMWTNGGEWYSVKETPLAWDFIFGSLCEVSNKTSLFNRGEVPLEAIWTEVQSRFPGRWTGEWRQDALGMRFWDPQADNETGCQVKPDGMLCFTGRTPFMKWADIFGRQWVEEQKVLNLGRAAEGYYFDGDEYWENCGGRWVSIARQDMHLRLKDRGLSDRIPKGGTMSDVDRVLLHLQKQNRVDGAAPLVNYAPGLVTLEGRPLLNTANLRCVQPAAGPTGTPSDFPFIWEYLSSFLARPELRPLDHLLAWLRRAYDSQLNYGRETGQALFICGPKGNGKTLFSRRIVQPLLGDRAANPMPFFTGDTNFNSELFEAALLVIDDEDTPRNEAARQKMLSRIKGFVVNPSQSYIAKFKVPVRIEWCGRFVATLNNDPASTGVLPEVNDNTEDKLSFYATQPRTKPWPVKRELEATLEKELPFFGHWLLNVWQPPQDVLSNDRVGVKSYFDPVILELSRQQMFSYNLAELLRAWQKVDSYWVDEHSKTEEWVGSPTELLTCLQTCDPLAGVAREWTQQKIAKSLTALARTPDSGVRFSDDVGRQFVVTRDV